MPPDAICLFPELKEIDPVLYGHLEDLDIRADMSQGQPVSDGCLDANDFSELQRTGGLSPADLGYYQRQFQYQRWRWDSLSPSARERWVAALRLVREGRSEDAARLIREAQRQPDLGCYVSRFFETELLWFDVYTGDWDRAASKAAALLSGDPDNPLALYASAVAANRTRNYGTAKSYLDHLQGLPSPPPFLIAESRGLEEEVTQRDPTLRPDLPAATSPLSLTEQRSYVNHIAARTLKDRARVRELLAGVEARHFDEVEKRFVTLVRGGQISPEELPWLVHVWFHTFLRYEALPALRSFSKAMANGVFDCTEYSEGMQRILSDAGVECTAVQFKDTADTAHLFVAYKMGAGWGFASVMSFEPPHHPSLSDVLGRWRQERFSGPFLVGRMRDGILHEQAVAPL